MASECSLNRAVKQVTDNDWRHVPIALRRRCVCGRDAGVLKEFLRELPEPLSSDSLYQMLMDALNVQISGDADGNARLMLGVLDCLPAVNQVCHSLMTPRDRHRLTGQSFYWAEPSLPEKYFDSARKKLLAMLYPSAHPIITKKQDTCSNEHTVCPMPTCKVP